MSYKTAISYNNIASAIADGYKLLRRFNQKELAIYEEAISMYSDNDFCIVDCAHEVNYGYRFALMMRKNTEEEKLKKFHSHYRAFARKYYAEMPADIRKNLPVTAGMAKRSLKAILDVAPFPDAVLLQRFREGEYRPIAKAIEAFGNETFAIVNCLRIPCNLGYHFALVCRKDASEREMTEFSKRVREFKTF